MSTLFDPKSFTASLSAHIRSELEKAAEPIIQNAIAEVEQHLRKRLAAMVVGFVDTAYDLERDGRLLRITVNLGPK